MKHVFPVVVALLLAPAVSAQTTAPSSTDQTNQAQTTGDPTAAPAAGATPPAAAALVKPTVGATVYGSAGTPVGTIKAMDAQLVTLTTAKGDVRLPVASVGPGPNGPVVGVTADQLYAAIDQAKAAQPVATSKTTSDATTDTKTTKTTTRKARTGN